MAMNSSVAAGRIVQTTSSVWLPWVKLTGRASSPVPSYFQMNQNSTTSVAMNTTPVSQRMK